MRCRARLSPRDPMVRRVRFGRPSVGFVVTNLVGPRIKSSASTTGAGRPSSGSRSGRTQSRAGFHDGAQALGWVGLHLSPLRARRSSMVDLLAVDEIRPSPGLSILPFVLDPSRERAGTCCLAGDRADQSTCGLPRDGEPSQHAAWPGCSLLGSGLGRSVNRFDRAPQAA